MAEKRLYKCPACDHSVAVDPTDDTVPECCGLEMKEELPVCTITDTAEHARFSDSGDPCDDGR